MYNANKKTQRKQKSTTQTKIKQRKQKSTTQTKNHNANKKVQSEHKNYNANNDMSTTTFCLFNNETDAILSYDYLNTCHNNIRFTMEKEVDKKLPFLDDLIDSSEPKSPHTSIYRKKMFSGLLTNYFSFCSFVYKIGLIRTQVDRAYKTNSTWVGLHKDLNKSVTSTLRKNLYPTKTVEMVIKNYLTNAKTREAQSVLVVNQSPQNNTSSYRTLAPFLKSLTIRFAI